MMAPLTAAHGARTVADLDRLTLWWSGGGAHAHRQGCAYMRVDAGAPLVSGSIRDAALALRRACKMCLRREREKIDRRIDSALTVAISRSCPTGLRVPEGWSWGDIHKEATRVRRLAACAMTQRRTITPRR